MIRSDVTRKRIAGVQPEERLSPDAYTDSASEAVYARMLDDAGAALDAGASVILDATFLDDAVRARVARAAAERGVSFTGLWLTAETAILESRIGGRGRDASDADLAVLHRQREPQDLNGWRIVDVGARDLRDPRALPPVWDPTEGSS